MQSPMQNLNINFTFGSTYIRRSSSNTGIFLSKIKDPKDEIIGIDEKAFNDFIFANNLMRTLKEQMKE